MSSPIAVKRKGIFKQLLIEFHQKSSHTNRIAKLAGLIEHHISLYCKKAASINCIDVGCGDMVIAEKIAASNPNTRWTCIDIHTLPEHLKSDDRWKKYKQFDGRHIPYKEKSFDVVVLCDVLHHAHENISRLLQESARVGQIVIIKDHFEYSIYSRYMLKLMDFVGNWGYGIRLPDRYFSEKQFENLCNTSNLRIIHLQKNIDLYSHLPLLNKLLRPQWQFIAILQAK
jgi:ubiquinone/menaquinone biosynthesis C-methylase UbiE